MQRSAYFEREADMTGTVQHRGSISGVRRRVGSVKSAIALAVVVTACFTSAEAHAQCVRCCFPAPNVVVSPATTEEGQPVVVTIHVLNCQGFRRVITAKVNVTPSAACASFAEAFSVTALVPPVSGRTLTYTLAAPKCEGTYKLTESSSNAPGSATTSLKVN
jgi:hypothetical protein